MMAQPWKEAKNKEFHAPLEDQAKKNHYFGGKETREAEELYPGDSPVVDNKGGDSPPSNLHDRAVGEAIAKMLDKYKGGMERPLLTKRRKLIMEANARLETITQKHGDGYRKWQEPMEKLYDKYEEQLEIFEKLERALQNIKLEEQKRKSFLKPQKCSQKLEIS